MKNALKKIYSWIIIDIAISFMFCIFAPIDIYFSNKDEFWFSIGQLMPVISIIFVLVLLFLIGLSFVMSITKFSEYVYCAVTGVFVYFYIQGNFIPRDYGVLNGSNIEWGNYTGYAIASIVLIALCIGFVFLVCFKFKGYIVKVGKMVGVFILIIQITTIITLFIQNMDLFSSDDTTSKIVTENALLDVSEDNNIIVFILDTFDGSYLNYLLDEDYETYAEIFEDFTYYRDTLGTYPTTKCALPFILTGQWYENEKPYTDYIEDAYKNNEIYTTLTDQNYTLDVYTRALYLSDDANLYENVQQGRYVISDNFDFAEKIYKLVAFNYMPHQMKRLISINTDDFDDLQATDSGSSAYSFDVQNFYESLQSEGLIASKSGNLFKLYHLRGVHPPYTFGKDLISNNNEVYTAYDVAAGNCVLMDKYLDELKKEGVYNNSTIIIMADHGSVGQSQNPIFLIKNIGENHDFQISDIPMSWQYLDDIYISLANGEYVDEEYIEKCVSADGTRRFLYYNWDDAWEREYMPGMEEMYATGPAYEMESLSFTGKVYLADSEDHSYNLGETLEFIDGRNGYNYCLYGIAGGNVRKEALLRFDILGEYENILVEIMLNDNCEIGNMDIYANDELVAQLYYGVEDYVSFVIPGEYLEQGELSLIFDQTAGIEGEERNISESSSLYIDQIVLSDTKTPFSLESQKNSYIYELGDQMFFTSLDDRGARYVLKGLSGPEESGTWMIDDETIFRFRINKALEGKDLVLYVDYLDSFHENQTVNVKIEDEIVDQFVVDGEGVSSIVISSDWIKGEYLDVVLEHPDAISPEELGLSADYRKLSIMLRSITLEEYQLGDV